MKKSVTLFSFLLLTAILVAQAPLKLTYQAVVRNSSNVLVMSTNIGMRISILQGSGSGTAVYVETQTPTTNANGLATIEIGGGSVVSGTFAGINWAGGPYFIKTEIAIAPPLTTYTITVTSQLLSVPYALYAGTAASYTETDPIYSAWNKSTGINITSSQVSDFQTSVTNNAAVVANTAKVTNATHTGDATGATALTVSRINGISLAGLATGILKNTTGTGVPSIAVAGTDFLAPNGSAALLTGFPTLNQNTTGSAASFTGSLAGEVTGTQSATVVGNAAVIGKTLTGYTSGAGTITFADNILQAIQKLNGNDAIQPNLTGPITSVGTVTSVASQTGTGSTFVMSNSPTLVTPNLGTPSALVGTNITGTAAGLTAGNVTTNANLTGEVTSVGNATTVTNAAVIGKVLNGFISGAGTITTADNILQAIQKLNGNIAALGGGTHYLGELFQGGIIFYLYKGSDGTEHGLIVNLTESSSLAWQNTGTSTGATSTWDGLTNTGVITDSPAKTYVTGLGTGWYWPSIDELNLLYNNRFHANKGLASNGGTLLQFADYWSSTEITTNDATSCYFGGPATGVASGVAYTGPKTGTGNVRSIRAF